MIWVRPVLLIILLRGKLDLQRFSTSRRWKGLPWDSTRKRLLPWLDSSTGKGNINEESVSVANNPWMQNRSNTDVWRREWRQTLKGWGFAVQVYARVDQRKEWIPYQMKHSSPNVRHARGDQFWPAARQFFPRKISKENAKRTKQLLSRKVSERKLKR